MAPKRARDQSDSEASISGDPAPKRLKFSTSSKPIKVTVGVGPDARDFYIHQDVLSRHSDFFKAALSNEWREAGEGVVRLPDDSPDDFEIFSDFFYSGQLAVDHDEPNQVISDEISFSESCWLLADKLLCQSFKDAAVDRTVEYVLRTKRVPLDMHEKVYRQSCVDSGLKRLLVDIAVLQRGVKRFKDTAQRFEESAFYADTTIRALEATAEEKDGRFPWINAGCKYHDHGNEKPCYKTMF